MWGTFLVEKKKGGGCVARNLERCSLKKKKQTTLTGLLSKKEKYVLSILCLEKKSSTKKFCSYYIF